jgi:hypothetical protein
MKLAATLLTNTRTVIVNSVACEAGRSDRRERDGHHCRDQIPTLAGEGRIDDGRPQCLQVQHIDGHQSAMAATLTPA